MGQTARVFLLFVSVLAALMVLQYSLQERLAPVTNGLLTVRASAGVINLLSPGERVRARGNQLESAHATLRVAQGCEGLDVLNLFLAAMVAVPFARPVSRVRRAVACVAGLLLLYGVNLLRVAGLWFVYRHWPGRFDDMHVLVGQSVVIVLALAAFAGLVWLLGRTASPRRALEGT